MNDQNKAHFIPTEKIRKTVLKVFSERKNEIISRFPGVDVQLVGSSCIPDTITLGDVDIQVRVHTEEFSNVKDFLQSKFEVNHPELCNDMLSIFKDYENQEIPVGYVITVIDSVYDEYYKVRDLFIQSPYILKKYTDLKKSFEGKSLEEYKKAKRNFFGENGKCKLLLSMNT